MSDVSSSEVDAGTGWQVVGGAHALMAVTFGSAYAFSVVFPGLVTEFGASRTEVALVFSISAFIFYSLGAAAGPIADRWSCRGLIMSGLVAMTIGYLGASEATSLRALYLWYGCGVGLGIGLTYIPALGAVQSWFLQRRGRASGISTAGIGVGALLVPLAAGQAVSALGWRGCFVMLACVIAAVGLPAARLVRRRPDSAPDSAIHPGVLTALRTRRFALFYVMLVLASFATFIPYVHIIPAARDLGLPVRSGSVLIGLIGVGSVVGRFVLAGLGDRIGPARLLTVLTFAVAASFALWSLANGMVMLALFAVAFGMSYGGCVGLYPAVASDLFGTRFIGTMLGYLYSAVGIAALLGPTLTGLVFDKTGSYRGPILFSMGAATLAGVLTLGLGKKEPCVAR